ncbi:MAG: DNA recombination protein RmuC [Alphaproteobacteria bacterium]|nr:DNA recombination protein RmuC [Alphaproteobacteria bacterium]
MEILIFAIGAGLGFLAAKVILKTPANTDTDTLKSMLATAQLEAKDSNARAIAAETKLTSAENFKEVFAGLSKDALELQRRAFVNEHKTNIDAQMKPFSDQLETFKKMVESDKLETGKGREYFKILSEQMARNVSDLSKILSNPKSAGDRGEDILEEILDLSGYAKGQDYFLQANFKDDSGNNRRPDCFIYLKKDSGLVIDSKVNTVNYAEYRKATDPDEAKKQLKSHTAAVKRHIDDLSTQEYHKYMKANALDFVVMFMPFEASYLAALEADPEIYAYAASRNVMVATPSSLLPILRTIKNLWDIEKRNENAGKIAARAGDLYDKINTHLEHLGTLRNALTTARTAFDKAVVPLSGRGGVEFLATEIKKLGAKTNNELAIPTAFSDTEGE